MESQRLRVPSKSTPKVSLLDFSNWDEIPCVNMTPEGLGGLLRYFQLAVAQIVFRGFLCLLWLSSGLGEMPVIQIVPCSEVGLHVAGFLLLALRSKRLTQHRSYKAWCFCLQYAVWECLVRKSGLGFFRRPCYVHQLNSALGQSMAFARQISSLAHSHHIV